MYLLIVEVMIGLALHLRSLETDVLSSGDASVSHTVHGQILSNRAPGVYALSTAELQQNKSRRESKDLETEITCDSWSEQTSRSAQNTANKSVWGVYSRKASINRFKRLLSKWTW